MTETADLDRSSSKLRESIKTYGQNSYYYAHSRPMEIPADAIRVEGAGLVTGGTPVRIAVGAAEVVQPTMKGLTSYAWADSEETVKIYVEEAEFLAAAAEGVTLEFEGHRFRLVANEKLHFTVDSLEDEISDCTWKLSKSRLTVTLTKKNKNKTWYALKKTSH